MSKLTSTGVTISAVQDVPATFDEAGYSALVYTKIGQVTNVPEFGPNVQVVESNPLETGVTEKFVGFINYGSLSVEADFDGEDAGQEMVTDAVTKDHASFGQPFAFKLEYLDGSVRYWMGKFFSATENPGSANSMITTTMQVEIDSVILKVAPTP